jgi:hypothetical protein
MIATGWFAYQGEELMMIAPVVVELDEADELDPNALVLQPPRLPVQRYIHLPAVQKTRQNTCKLIASSCYEYLVRVLGPIKLSC